MDKTSQWNIIIIEHHLNLPQKLIIILDDLEKDTWVKELKEKMSIADEKSWDSDVFLLQTPLTMSALGSEEQEGALLNATIVEHNE